MREWREKMSDTHVPEYKADKVHGSVGWKSTHFTRSLLQCMRKWSAKCSKSLLPCGLVSCCDSCYTYHGKLMSVLAESFFLMSSRSGILRAMIFVFHRFSSFVFHQKDNREFDWLLWVSGFLALLSLGALMLPLTLLIHHTFRFSKSSARRRSSAKRQSRSQLFQSFSPKCGGKI